MSEETDAAQVDVLIEDLDASYLWRGDAPRAVRDLLARLPETPGTVVQRARLTLLSIDDLVRDAGAAHAAMVVVEVRDRAAMSGHQGLRARAERTLSGLFRDIGDPSTALEHAVAALALDSDDLDPVLRCRLRQAMADALAASGSFDDARLGYREALERARSTGTPWLPLVVLNNWAYTELLAGELGHAAELVEQVRAVADQHGMTLNLVTAGTVAEVFHAGGRSDEAIAMLREHLRTRRSHDVITAAGAWLTLAQIQRETGDLDAAEASLEAAGRLTSTHGFRRLAVEGIGSRAELLAARGDFAGAYETHRRFHAGTLELRSAAADARAQTLLAMLEVDETRRESARYRQMSYRDPLTQLFNRRHVDEDLDARLARGAALAVAMVDLDHFKRVNDTCSHQAGDAVLVRLAALLEEAAATIPGAYAARLGGEEFLLVLPGADLARARAVAEDLRRRIAATDWSDIAPGVPVTASTGLATTAHPPHPPPDRADLVRRADHHLYAAKAAGRDRVEPAPTSRG